MALPPGMYIPDAAPPSPGGDGGDLEVDPAALEELKKALEKAAGLLETDRFADVDLDAGAFGASPTGQTLGAEHRVAHQIIADTITGVVTDLWGYRDGVTVFETNIGNAEQTAVTDLNAQQEGVEALTYSSASDNAGERYRSSQADHLAGRGPQPGSGAADSPGAPDTTGQEGD